MPEITAFRGLRYNTQRFTSDLSTLIAPPYDVLEAEDKAALLRTCEQNIVAVDLPHMPPKSAGPDELYAKAAETLQSWRDSRIITQDEKPALYAYHQIYQHAGQTFTRKMFFARMRLEAFGTGTVFPHEQTFGGPKEDRFKLMRATRCQLSPIFGLYRDPDYKVSELLNPGDRPADVAGTLQGIENRLWLIQDPATIRAVCAEMADRAVFIADGHHRYGTALNYRDALQQDNGPLPADHPAQFVLAGLCAMEDPGCVILPTHRVLADFGKATADEILAALGQGLTMTPQEDTALDPASLLPADSPHDLAIYIPADDRRFLADFAQRNIMDTLAPEQSKAWRRLDLAYLHRYLIDELVTENVLAGKAPKVHCIKSAEQTIRIAREKNGIALLTKACTMDDLRGVSEAGDLMPQKSTFFYPKLATGLVINPLE